MKDRIIKTVYAGVAGAAMVFTFATFASAQAAKPGAPPAAGKAAPGKPGAKGPQISPEQQKNMIAMVNDKLKHRFTPSIKSVVIGPAAVGKPVKVTITAAYEDKRAIDKIVEAAIYYTLDNGKTFIGPVVLKAAGAGTWSGAIPGIKKAGKAVLFPRVKDSYGNVAIQLPCKVASWPPLGDGCMSPGAIGPENKKPTEIIEDNFKVLDLRVGMDDKYFYIDQSMEGNIKKGTMNPTHINMYMAMVVDSKALGDFNDAAVLMQPDAKQKMKGKEGLALPLIYAPLASAAAGSMADSAAKQPAAGDKGAKPGNAKAATPPPAKPNIPSRMVPRQHNGKMEMDGTSVKCKADGPDLFIRLDRGIMPPSMKDSFIVLGALNGFIDNMQAPIPKIREVTGFTRVSFKAYPFTVK
jgi:hypothetical protein